MSAITAYYPFILYAIPYLIAAYVLIRARLKERREARRADPEENVVCTLPPSAPANDGDAPTGTRISRILSRIASRSAA